MRLSALLGKFSGVQSDGAGAFLAVCPVHGDHDPSLRIARGEDNRALLKCRSQGCDLDEICKAAGVQKRSLFNVTGWSAAGIPEQAAPATELPLEAVAKLAAYVDTTRDRLQDGSEPSRTALDYLRRRFGITPELARDLRLGVDPGSDAIDFEYTKATFRQVPRLTVPFIDFDGAARGLQGRALTDHRVRWSGLYGDSGRIPWTKHAYLHGGANTDVVIITEGPGDGLTAVGAGHDAIVVAGASIGNQSLAEMLAPHLQGRRVILAGDADSSGSAFSTRLGEALTALGVDARRLALPEPKDDLSKWYERDPVSFAKSLYQAIRDAVPFAVREAPETEQSEAGGDLDYVARHPHTDLGNTKRLYDRLNGLVRYTDAAGFFLWYGQYWAHDGRSQVRTEAQAVAEDVYAYAQTLAADNPYKGSWQKHAHVTQSSGAIAAMVRDLEAMAGVHCDINDFDANPNLLAVQNGVIDLRAGELIEADPGMMISRRLSVAFDPDAKAPRWERFLSEIFPGHPELVPYVRRLVGYGITGHTSEQMFAVLYGRGANGKSVLTDTLTTVFRAITVTTAFSTFESKPGGGIPNDVAALKGSRLVMASEGDQGRYIAEALIKRVTGSDLVQARFMRQEFFEFKPSFLIMLATNHKPLMRGQDEGLWRRVKLIPFSRYFEPDERDQELSRTLQKEAAGILAWAVRGAVEWYEGGLQEPAVITAAVDSYKESSDALSGFFPWSGGDNEGLILDTDSVVLGNHAYLAYCDWAASEGLKGTDVWKRQTFYRAMEERKVPRERREKGQTLVGVRKATKRDKIELSVNPSVVASVVRPGRLDHVSGIGNVRGDSDRSEIANRGRQDQGSGDSRGPEGNTYDELWREDDGV